MSLARLLATRGGAQEGRRIVAEVHGWFTEGAETEDLALARKLIGGR